MPLWEADLVDGFGNGCAILLRTHHAIADGTALVQALLSLADPPDGGPSHAGQRPLAEGAAFGVPIRGLFRPSGVSDGRPGLMDHARAVADRAAMLRRLGFAPRDEPSVLRGPLSGRKRMTWSPAGPSSRPNERGGRTAQPSTTSRWPPWPARCAATCKPTTSRSTDSPPWCR
jgi:hypothetical protein